jgi:hypothetical protein
MTTSRDEKLRALVTLWRAAGPFLIDQQHVIYDACADALDAILAEPAAQGVGEKVAYRWFRDGVPTHKWTVGIPSQRQFQAAKECSLSVWTVQYAYAQGTPLESRQAQEVTGADEAMARHWIERYAAGIDANPQLDLIAAALNEGLFRHLRDVYRMIPSLPVTEESKDEATSALTAFCMAIGVYEIEKDANGETSRA